MCRGLTPLETKKACLLDRGSEFPIGMNSARLTLSTGDKMPRSKTIVSFHDVAPAREHCSGEDVKKAIPKQEDEVDGGVIPVV